MESLREILKHPDELFYLLKLKMALRGAEKHNIPADQPHWSFCYTMLYKFLRNPLIFQQFDTNIRDARMIQAYLQSHQETIVDISQRMGAGMAKFICKEIVTTEDYDEYCHYSAGLVEIGLSKFFNASQKQDPIMEELCGSTFIFYQDLKYKENSIKAVQCLNEMVTDALKHAGDCLKHLSTLNDDHAALQFLGVKGIGTSVLCYNNIEVFKAKVRLRRGLAARLYEQTKTMSDIYNVDMHDPNAKKTLSRLNEIQEICRKSGLLCERNCLPDYVS
ncbi:hypothetical protein EZV62_011627 [Acer yangbiense]|uniref:Uncharacterized protein n=1 Tax=Acer yangbiense TaxID=1000413 RepID=A0A5C7I524_9ROSI|nr:hypothetical protein EZV62_011627 [Acer yangbiense]